MKRILMMVVLMVLTTMVLAIGAEKKQEPFTVVTSEEVKAMIDRQEPGLVIIDVRTPEEFQEVHINGAVNLPFPDLDKKPSVLTFSKDSKLLFYCNGFKCGMSPKAAQLAAALGYLNLYVLSEGMPVWEEKGFAIYTGPDYEKKIETIRITPQKLQSLMVDRPNDITIVDVRDPKEYAEGHIPGAVNIPVSQFAARSNILEKEKKVIVYCNSGNRSYNAYRKLKKMGYWNVAEAIFADWKEAGLPVSKSTER
jgi:rhodanese-related sulfurtransferase